MKALGTGMSGVAFREIAVAREPGGPAAARPDGPGPRPRRRPRSRRRARHDHPRPARRGLRGPPPRTPVDSGTSGGSREPPRTAGPRRRRRAVHPEDPRLQAADLGTRPDRSGGRGGGSARRAGRTAGRHPSRRLSPPGLSGFDVLRRLKEDPRTASIPVIVLTARTHPDERATGLRLGASRFLTKPFSTKALLEELEGVLAAARGDGVGGPSARRRRAPGNVGLGAARLAGRAGRGAALLRRLALRGLRSGCLGGLRGGLLVSAFFSAFFSVFFSVVVSAASAFSSALPASFSAAALAGDEAPCLLEERLLLLGRDLLGGLLVGAPLREVEVDELEDRLLGARRPGAARA